jgi:hypothetical protein
MSSRNRSRSGGSANKALAELFRSGVKKITTGEVKKLRAKYGDDIADQIIDEFYSLKDETREQAHKAANYLRNKYPHKPLHVLLKSARKWKDKLGLNEFQFEEFRRIYEAKLSGQSVAMSRIVEPHRHTNLMEKTLGSGYQEQTDGLHIKDSEYGDLQEILKMHAVGKQVHSEVVLQHVTFKGVDKGDVISLAGLFREDKDRAECHIHPVVAALFLPKVDILDKHFLVANLAGIIKGRKNRELITNKPDYILHKAITTDPNDVVCDPHSAMRDLKFRCALQHHLLNSVKSLRNGSYFDCHNREFINAIENCKLNNFDNPDLLYSQDETNVLSKLLGAFSFRPTVLAQRPLATFDPNPKPTIPKIYTRHMLTFRLRRNRTNQTGARDIKEVLSTVEYRREDGHFIPYEEKVVYSNQVLFVIVPRKLMTIDLSKMLGQSTQPINLLDLPRNLTGFERLDDFSLNVPKSLQQVGNQSFNLVSFVSAKVNKVGPQVTRGFIIGNMAWVKTNRSGDESWICYDPRRVTKGQVVKDNTLQVDGKATERIARARPMFRFTEDEVMTNARHYGTVFVYSNGAVNDLLRATPMNNLIYTTTAGN